MAALTTNFDSSEFDVGSPWPNGYAANRLALAQLAQWLRNLAGVPGKITSAGRDPAHNAEVGGTENSQHTRMEAIDIVFPTSLRALANKVLSTVEGGTAPAFGQIIFYVDKGHLHVSLPTLGSRNGELRYSFTSGKDRVYPFLTRASLPQLPGTALAGAVSVPLIAGLAVVGLVLLGLRRWSQ